MYRGSRLAASFLLFFTGTAATAIGLAVVPSLVERLADRRARHRVRHRPLPRTVRNRPRLANGAARWRYHRRSRGRHLLRRFVRDRDGRQPLRRQHAAAAAGPRQRHRPRRLVAGMYVLLGISAGRVQFEGWKRPIGLVADAAAARRGLTVDLGPLGTSSRPHGSERPGPTRQRQRKGAEHRVL